MIYVLDACTFINLANSGQLPLVFKLPGRTFWLSGSVRSESSTIAHALQAAVANGSLKEIDDSALSGFEFDRLKSQFNLGDGETECILAAKTFDWNIACDDRAARKAAAGLLGKSKVTGSIGLLKQCVAANSLDARDALQAYRRMVLAGGFLPVLTIQNFTDQ